MSFTSRQVRTAVKTLGNTQLDDAVSAALLKLGDPPFTKSQVKNALLAAKVPPSAVADVIDYLEETDPDKQAKLVEEVKAEKMSSPAVAGVRVPPFPSVSLSVSFLSLYVCPHVSICACYSLICVCLSPCSPRFGRARARWSKSRGKSCS